MHFTGVFGVSNKARLNPIFSTTETSQKIEISLEASLDMILSNKRITKCADQASRMRRLVCADVVHKPPKTAHIQLFKRNPDVPNQ